MKTKEYPPDWDDIAERIKKKNDYRCEICGHPHDPGSGYCLTVHHLDRDVQNNEEYNLGSACQRDHLRLEAYARKLEELGTNIFKDSWYAYFAGLGIEADFMAWFKPHWEGYLQSVGNKSKRG